MSPLHRLHDCGLIQAPQIVALRLLTADWSGAPPTSIVRSTGLSKTVVSMAVKSLIDAGMVERRRLFMDKRSSMLYLTPEGRQKALAMEEALTDYVDDVKKRQGRVHP